MKAIKKLAAAAGEELVAETFRPGMTFEDLACEVCRKLRAGTEEPRFEITPAGQEALRSASTADKSPREAREVACAS